MLRRKTYFKESSVRVIFFIEVSVCVHKLVSFSIALCSAVQHVSS